MVGCGILRRALNLEAGDEGRDGEEGLQAAGLAARMAQQGRLRCWAGRRLCMQVLEQPAEQHEVLGLLVAHLPEAHDMPLRN